MHPDSRPAGIAIAVALVWSCAPLLVVLSTPRRVLERSGSPPTQLRHGSNSSDGSSRLDEPGQHDEPAPRRPTVTTVVRVGDEPVEIARSSVALAVRAGPTVIVSRRDDLTDELTAGADSVHIADTVEAALLAAANSVTTEAVLVISARSVPEMGACADAAALLDERIGWITGTTRPFNQDRFSSDRREVVGARLRRCAAIGGVELWENDATLVRTDLFAQHPVEPGRPWGNWLRARATEGLRGARVDDALSLRAAPVAAASYWPDALARQRAGALDIAAAAVSGRPRARMLAALLLCRELYAYPLIVWLLLPALLRNGVVFDLNPWAAALALGPLAMLRWWSLRHALSVETLPRSDIIAAWYHAPGSLAAPVALIRRRLRPSRHATPTRPLVWAGLALTVVAADGVLRQTPGAPTSRAAVALSLALLGMLWAFTIRALVERNWTRTSYRVRVDLAADVGGAPGRTVDGSPGGVAVSGRFPGSTHPPGAEVVVEVTLDDGSTMRSPAVVAARRRSRHTDLLGLELHPGPAALDGWSAQLLRAATEPGIERPTTVSHEVSTTGRRGAECLDRIVMALVVVTSAAVTVALVLVLLGFRPLVVRSGSMVPNYQVGDVVLVEQIRADELRPGEVVSLDYFPDFGEGMTHRVRSVRSADGTTEVETRGDANDSSEDWAVSSDTMVGRVVASIPAIGAPATLVRTATIPLVVGLIALGAIVMLVLRGRPDRPPAPDRTTSTEVPVDHSSSDLS